MNLFQLNSIPWIKINEDILSDMLDSLKPVLDRIDLSNKPLSEEDKKKILHDWIAKRIYKYVTRLATEFTLTKAEDIKNMFYQVVNDIYINSCELLNKESEITFEELSILHKKLYPKWLWWITVDKKGRTFKKLYPAWTIRTDKEIVRYEWWDYSYLDPKYINESLKKVSSFYQEEIITHPLIRIILSISCYGYIHPFYNWNGTLLMFYTYILLLKKWYPMNDMLYKYFTGDQIWKDLINSRHNDSHGGLFRNFLETFS